MIRDNLQFSIIATMMWDPIQAQAEVMEINKVILEGKMKHWRIDGHKITLINFTLHPQISHISMTYTKLIFNILYEEIIYIYMIFCVIFKIVCATSCIMTTQKFLHYDASFCNNKNDKYHCLSLSYRQSYIFIALIFFSIPSFDTCYHFLEGRLSAKLDYKKPLV